MKNALRILLAALVVVLLVGAIALSLVDRFVKSAIEESGIQMTGTSVLLRDVDISLRKGSASLYGLSIANPAMFSVGHAIELDEITIDVELGSVNSGEIVFERIVIDGAQINFEESGGRTNMQELLNRMQRFADREGTTATEGETPKLVIQDFRFTNAKASITTAGQPQRVTIAIPDLELTDIGRKGAGVTPAEAGQQIMRPLLSKFLENSQRGLLDTLKANTVDRIGGLLRGYGSDETDSPTPAE